MSRNNAAAWEQIKKNGLTVDVQVYPNDDGSQTAYVGTVYKDRTFAGTGFMGTKKFFNNNEAIRDTRAVARAISRKTGIPLHPSVPSERQKQISSHTIGRAQLKVMHQMRQRQSQSEYEDSPRGRLEFIIFGIVVSFICMGSFYLCAWILSLTAR